MLLRLRNLKLTPPIRPFGVPVICVDDIYPTITVNLVCRPEGVAESGDATVVFHGNIARAEPSLAQGTAWGDVDQGPLLAILPFRSDQAEPEAEPLLEGGNV